MVYRLPHKRSTNRIYAAILVGGKGKRLRPLSTDARPKAFLSITRDRKTMFRKTIDRVRRIVPLKNILVVANKAHSKLVRDDFPSIDKKNLLLESASRNTAPAITLAALTLQGRSEDAIMLVLPTDQYIMDEDKYLNSIKEAIDFVKDNKDALLVLGIVPRYPATGFGYMKTKNQMPKTQNQKIYKVERFTEKPNLKTAKRYVKSKRFLWNAGAFIFAAGSILNAVKKYAPKIFNGLKNLNLIDKNYRRLPDISIDYAVMEKADEIWCVRGSYSWLDAGSFDSLRDVLAREGREFVVRNGKVVRIL